METPIEDVQNTPAAPLLCSLPTKTALTGQQSDGTIIDPAMKTAVMYPYGKQ